MRRGWISVHTYQEFRPIISSCRTDSKLDFIRGFCWYGLRRIMKSTTRLALLAASCQLTVFCSTLGAAPLNDNFADALPVDPLSYSFTGNLQGTTREPGEPIGPYSDVGSETLWWSFVPTRLGILSVSAQADLWQPRPVAYQGSVLTNLESLAAGATVQVRTDAAQAYRFQLTSVLGYESVGDFALNASFTPAPANDLFANRIQLDGTNETVRSWFLDASGEPLADPAITRTLWWSQPNCTRVR